MGESVGDWRPIPDPTTLTVQLVARELAALKEQLDYRLAGLKEHMDLRHDADQELYAAHIVAITDATAKAEVNLTKQLDQQHLLAQTGLHSLESKITDAKERLTRLDGQSTGKMELWAIFASAFGLIISFVSLGLTFLRH